MFKITLIVPTYNAGHLWQKWIERLTSQDIVLDEIIVIDSSSIDNTVMQAKNAGFTVYSIYQSEFNHGKTRNYAVSLSKNKSDILVFLTQDALLANDNSITELVSCFSDPNVSAAYGRQLPHKNANPIAAHARLFNYPNLSCIKGVDDIPKLGIKTAFISNSFSAYRRTVFETLGGFPDDVILAEDMYLSAKMILSGYCVAYCSNAVVYHSHNYSYLQEFSRYFDTGVFHAKEPWIKEYFGGVKGEGKRFIFSEIRYLVTHAPTWIPKALLTTFFKALGFKLGKSWAKLPKFLLKKFSMHKAYWKF